MEISVRSPHGDADVAVTATATTTLADVVGTVTGQAVPALVDVDGRPVRSTTRLVDAHVRTGSVVTSERSEETAESPAVTVVVLAGPGTGRAVPLPAGRYRLGPGRRVNDRELRAAPVESTAFEVDVAANGVVHVDAIADDVAVDGITATGRTRLVPGAVVSTSTRAFAFDPGPADARVAPARGEPAIDGTVVITRPPRSSAPRRPSRPVSGALDVAVQRTEALWERRPEDEDAFAVDVGVVIDAGWRAVRVPVHAPADAASAAGLGIVGSEAMRTGLARTVMIELATAHTPGDLRIIVATARPDHWEWSKWLPHLRGPHGHHVVRPEAVEGLVGDAPLTLVVADDPSAWMQVDGPLRGVWPALPPTVHVVALCSTRSEAPSICTTMIDEQRSGRVSITGRRRTAIDDVLPASTDEETATTVARLLAPLVDDTDLRREEAAPMASTDWFELAGLPADATADDVRSRWSAGRSPEDAAAPTIVRAASLRLALDVAAGLVTVRAAHRSPERLRVLPITDHDTVVAHLPHADPALGIDALRERTTAGAVGADRLARRLRALLADADGPDEVVVLLEVEDGTDDRTVADIADSAGDGISVVVATDAATPAATAAVTVEETANSVQLRIADAAGSRVATLDRPAAPQLEIRPFVSGRRPNDTERRLARDLPRRIDPGLERLVQLLADAAGAVPERRPLAPPPAPTELRLADLLRAHPGDGVPLGLVDRPELDEPQPWWWQPGDGSVLAVGHDTTAAGRLVEAALAGIAARFGDDEPGVLVISRDPARRDANAGSRPSGTAVTGDQVDTTLLDDAMAGGWIVLIEDLAAWPRSPEVDQRLGELIRRGDVIATTSAIAGVEAHLPAFERRVLGPSDDPAAAARLGVDEPPDDPSTAVLARDGSTLHLAAIEAPR